MKLKPVLFSTAIIFTGACDQSTVDPVKSPATNPTNQNTATVYNHNSRVIKTNIRTESPKLWFSEGQQDLQNALALQPNTKQAKNIILFVADGMGISTITAARILEGQIKGGNGEENILAFEGLPYLAHSKVYNTNQQVPDSAGTMTAMMSGIKTKAGIIGLNQHAVRGNCQASKGTETTSHLAQAERNGLSTGIITTASLTHATPAATYAHSPDRTWESSGNMPFQAKNEGCKDIADQLVNFSEGDGIDVAMGGGRQHFLPRDSSLNSGEQLNSIEGIRTDKRNLVQEWQTTNPEGHYIIDQSGFNAIDTEQTSKLLGLFNEHYMQFENDRQADILGEPSLSEMTYKAIHILDNNPKGFFLMVESGLIDQAHHIGSANYALAETIQLSKAVKVALDNTDSQETLIIVTADHGNALTMAGYATRGNPILGKVSGNNSSGLANTSPTLDRHGNTYTTLTYTNGYGFAEDAPGHHSTANAGRHNINHVDTQDPGFHQESLIDTGAETHSGEDVAIYASGPWAHLFHRTHEQNYIYHVMNHAAFSQLNTPEVK